MCIKSVIGMRFVQTFSHQPSAHPSPGCVCCCVLIHRELPWDILTGPAHRGLCVVGTHGPCVLVSPTIPPMVSPADARAVRPYIVGRPGEGARENSLGLQPEVPAPPQIGTLARGAQTVTIPITYLRDLNLKKYMTWERNCGHKLLIF